MLNWERDQGTADWAKEFCLVSGYPAEQYDGSNSQASIERAHRATTADSFPDWCFPPERPDRLLPSPNNIIRCWQEGLELEALFLTVRWGTMGRTARFIYTEDLQGIRKLVREARRNIERDRSVQSAWELLAAELHWSQVISSKCLHFMARSLGYTDNPPVPIDNAIILKRVAPAFDQKILNLGGDPKTLGAWNDPRDSWAGYNCYMTAILCWAERLKWSTTKVECTLFRKYGTLSSS